MAKKSGNGRIDPQTAARVLRKLQPSEAFWFFTDIGQYANESSASFTDFAEKLGKVPLKSIEFHFKRRDFENWIRKTLADEYLADKIGKIHIPTQGEELRKTMQEMVKNRLCQLKSITQVKTY